MASPLNWYDLTASKSGSTATTVPTAAPDKSVSRDTFLKLLVAQIRNQNPLSPADGIEFLTQLSQFTELEQLMGMRQDLETIRDSLTAAAPDDSAETAAKSGGV
jgi:flagellar basal-body rod modification protein FlgD